MKYKAKDRMAIISKRNIKKIVKYYDADLYDLSSTVNYLVDIAIGELRAINEQNEREESELKELRNE